MYLAACLCRSLWTLCFSKTFCAAAKGLPAHVACNSPPVSLFASLFSKAPVSANMGQERSVIR